MNGKQARRLRRERAVQQFVEDTKTVYLANRKVPGQVFAANVTWETQGPRLSATCLAGSVPAGAVGEDRAQVYFQIVNTLVADMKLRGYDVVHVAAAMLRDMPKGFVEDTRDIPVVAP